MHYHKIAVAAPAGLLPVTGVSILYTLLTLFVLVSAGVALIKLAPKFRRNR